MMSLKRKTIKNENIVQHVNDFIMGDVMCALLEKVGGVSGHGRILRTWSFYSINLTINLLKCIINLKKHNFRD